MIPNVLAKQSKDSEHTVDLIGITKNKIGLY